MSFKTAWLAANQSQSNRYFQVGLLLAIVGTALFALKSIIIKLAFQAGTDATTLLFLRMLISAPIYAAILVWQLRVQPLNRPSWRVLLAIFVLGFFGYYLASFLDMQGLHYITAQLERLILYTYPIMTTLLSALFLKERITKRVWLALALTYAGIVVMYLHELSLGDQTAVTLGILLVMGSALSYSLYVIFSKAYIQQLGSLIFTSLAMLASTCFVLLHYALQHSLTDVVAIEPTIWAYALLLAIFSTVLPSFMVVEAIRRIGPSRTTIVGTAGPVFTILIAVWLLNEPFGWWHIAGVALVLLGVGVLSKK